MDYVVYGTGYGATLMLLGYALRTWGPKWRYRDEDERAFAAGELRSARAAWSRFTTGLGAVLATCGVVLILFTFALMLANPGDEVSEMVSLIISGLLLIGVAAWAWLYFSRFGAFGVTRPPLALTSQANEPIRYDARQTQTVPAATAAASSDEDDDSVDQEEDDSDLEEFAEEVYEPDEDDVAEMEARYSKFETHHPAEEETETSDEAESAISDDDDRDHVTVAETVDSPEVDEAPEVSDGEGVDDVVSAPEIVEEAERPEPTGETEAGADDSVVEHVVVHAAEPVDENGGSRTELVEVTEETEFVESTDASSPADGGSQSGRDDALQRLRERQKNRARRADDA